METRFVRLGHLQRRDSKDGHRQRSQKNKPPDDRVNGWLAAPVTENHGAGICVQEAPFILEDLLLFSYHEETGPSSRRLCAKRGSEGFA